MTVKLAHCMRLHARSISFARPVSAINHSPRLSILLPCSRSPSLVPAGPHKFTRTFSYSGARRAALAQHPASRPTVLVSYPSPQSLEDVDEDSDEPDVEFVPPKEARIEITDRAAEQLRAIAGRENNPNAALRIAVESGGCHGYQYKMELAKSKQSDDYHFSHPSVKPSNIYVDAVSMALLKGSTIDFATELIGSSFRVVDNPQAKGSGCGCGVSWELKI